MTAQDTVHVTMAVAPVARAELLQELGRLLASVRGREHEAERHFAASSSVPALR